MSLGPGGRYLRFLAVAGLVAAAAGALGAPWTRQAGGPGAGWAMVAALAVCWAGAAVGGVPVLRAARREGAALHVAALAAMALRLAVVVAGAAALAVAGAVPRAPLLLWTGVGYVALLVVETWYAVGEVRRRGPAGAAAAGGPGGRDETDETTQRPRAAAGRPARTETR